MFMLRLDLYKLGISFCGAQPGHLAVGIVLIQLLRSGPLKNQTSQGPLLHSETLSLEFG